MNAELKIIEIVEADPTVALTNSEKLEAYLQAVEREHAPGDADLSTDKSRKEIASRAHAVVKKKTFLDNAGKELNEDARRQIAEVDARRRAVRDRLDALRDAIRKPLDDWQKQEDARVEWCNGIIKELTEAQYVQAGTPSSEIAARLEKAKSISVNKAEFLGLHDKAVAAQFSAIRALETAHALAVKAEEQAAELERLRAEAAERERAEQERLAQERAEAEAREAERRVQEQARAAAEQAKAEAEKKAQEEIARQKAAHEAELAAIRQREAEEARRREAEEAEAKRRAADVEHRSNIMRQAKEAIMEHGSVKEDAAKKIVLAIAGGNVPNVSIRF